MAEPISGRVTGIAVDPSDPNHPDDTFVFNVTPGPDDNRGDTAIIIDYREGDGGYVIDWRAGDGSVADHDGVSVAGGDAVSLPYIELPAVQFVGDASSGPVDDFAK